MARYAVVGGKVLLPTGFETDAVVIVEDGEIVEIASEAGAARAVDARGLYVMPGIIDLHGDAFERQIMPRPGVHFDLQLALADTDRQLVSNGITTAFHGVTYSWEPGLRSRDTILRMIAALDAARPHLACDTKLHLRQETYNLDGEAEALAWLAEGKIALLAFNDHTPDMLKKQADPQEMMTYLQRTRLSSDELRALLAKVAARKEEVPASIQRLAAAAVAAGVPQCSHDDPSPETRRWYQDIACEISEFPKTRETAQLARDLGNHIVFGAPNVVRGGSHQKNSVAAADMIAAGLCTVLTSDYYYPSMLPAAFRLERDGVCDLAAAWALISANPADAARLTDRGRIAAGLRADLLLVEAAENRPPRAVASLVAGKLAHAGKGAPSPLI
ncbi:MAG: alpha-D-ribose 1-methylphosphonate 5-triphosphate diphosphatase [Alphaproteobacteria bacterium]